jgi:hypothetical protein
MTASARKRTRIVGFLGILLLSATIMLWMVWHYPLATTIASFLALAALGIAARLARWIDGDLERKRPEHGV